MGSFSSASALPVHLAMSLFSICVVLSLLAEIAQTHVFDHAAAQRTDGRLAHRSANGLEVRLLIPSSSSQGTSDSVNRACSCPQRCWRRCRRLPRERFRSMH